MTLEEKLEKLRALVKLESASAEFYKDAARSYKRILIAASSRPGGLWVSSRALAAASDSDKLQQAYNPANDDYIFTVTREGRVEL